MTSIYREGHPAWKPHLTLLQVLEVRQNPFIWTRRNFAASFLIPLPRCYMRINLSVPFADKDLAKRRGAWWDPVKKIWYIQDQHCNNLEAFRAWIPFCEFEPTQSDAGPVKTKRHKPKPVKTTMPSGEKTLIDCGCDHIPPWEDCEHTDAAAQLAMEDQLRPPE